MISEGKNHTEINESFWDIFSTLGSGFKKTLEDYAVQWILNKFGVPQKDAEGNDYFLAELARAIVIEMDFMHFMGYFGKGSCDKWTEAVVKGVERAGVNKLSRVLLEAIGLKAKVGIAETLEKTLTNSLASYIQTKEFFDNVRLAIAGTICGPGGMQFKDMLSGASDEDKKKIGQNISQESEKNPNTIKAAQRTGIMSLLGFGSE